MHASVNRMPIKRRKYHAHRQVPDQVTEFLTTTKMMMNQLSMSHLVLKDLGIQTFVRHVVLVTLVSGGRLLRDSRRLFSVIRAELIGGSMPT